MSTHHFEPNHYYSTLGSHTPVLTLCDGDTVTTSTLDASGRDKNLSIKHVGVNPMTGPFAVSDAYPGDTLAVRLDEITPNRRYGWTLTQLALNVVDPEDVVLPVLSWGQRDAEWDVDIQAKTATLMRPKTNLGKLVVPIRPMVGCFGVAPADGEAISTATSGKHGGNMDFNEFTSGVEVHFPVLVDGALFHIGDCHAAQGCGEVAGTGIEISCDVQFTVRIIKDKTITWPRADDGEHIITIGNARPLDQAVQHATSEMNRWLRDDYGLDEIGIACLLGQCAEYRIGNVYDPAYTVACKLSKALLETVGK